MKNPFRGNDCRWGLALGALVISTALGAPDKQLLTQRRWFEARTAHFYTYSCGPTQEVAKLTARLEQFREAYGVLAGAEAVASPPIVVMAFPDHASMRPYLPLYQGKPANLEAFSNPGSDENFIALPLSGSGSMEVIFHEYAHLLMRHNTQFWPIWLKEGMAEIYGTFEVTGAHSARMAEPLLHHVRLLTRQGLLPLKELVAVTHDSPEYNEREHQGVFYAESWLLTHYLMLGDNASHRARFGQMTILLRQGLNPEQAFTNAFRTSLAAMDNELRHYLERGRFESLPLTVRADLTAPRPMVTRGIPLVEVWFRLGDMLMRVHRFGDAESCFLRGQKLAPANPLPFEGLGLLASERDQSAEALHWLRDALQHGSGSFLAHYVYAREKFDSAAVSPGWHSRLGPAVADEIRTQLDQSLALMPDFGAAHHLLGLFEFIQGDDLAGAVKHLQRAIQLEPENEGYVLSLAQAQLQIQGPEAARHILEPLRLPYVEARVRAQAEELLQKIARGEGR